MNHSKRELKRRLRRAIRFVRSNKFERVAAEIKKYPELRNFTDGDESLICAAFYGNINCLEFLLDNGVDIETKYTTGDTVLTDACSVQDLELVKLLLRRGADVNNSTYRGESPFSYACARGNVEIARFLFESGANINPLLSGWYTPMDNENHEQKIKDFLKSIGAKRASELKQ